MFSWKFSKKEEKVELKAEVPIVEEIEQVKALTDLADEALSKAANSVARGLVIDAICTYAGLKIKEEYDKEPEDRTRYIGAYNPCPHKYRVPHSEYVDANLMDALVKKGSEELSSDIIEFIRG